MAVIKQIVISKMSEKERIETLKEAQILQIFNHPNIVRFRESYKTKKGHLCIVMDYADGGDLAKAIEDQRGRYFNESQILDWFTQICLGMKHVHDRKILHRDIKCQNVFLTKQGIIKLGDFGIARVLRHTYDVSRSMVGTPYYLSPEIIEGRPYSFKSDIWSLGVMLYEMCALKPPFEGMNMHFLAMHIVRGKFQQIPLHFSRELRSLVNRMLTIDVSKRPSINQILGEPFIAVRIKKFLEQNTFKDEFSHTILHKKQVVLGNPETFQKPVSPVALPQTPIPPQKQLKPLPSNRYGAKSNLEQIDKAEADKMEKEKKHAEMIEDIKKRKQKYLKEIEANKKQKEEEKSPVEWIGAAKEGIMLYDAHKNDPKPAEPSRPKFLPGDSQKAYDPLRKKELKTSQVD